MTKALAMTSLMALLLASGCSGMSAREQRMLSGGAIGAAGGAVIGSVTGGSAVTGAVIGGVGGAAIGAVTGHH